MQIQIFAPGFLTNRRAEIHSMGSLTSSMMPLLTIRRTCSSIGIGSRRKGIRKPMVQSDQHPNEFRQVECLDLETDLNNAIECYHARAAMTSYPSNAQYMGFPPLMTSAQTVGKR